MGFNASDHILSSQRVSVSLERLLNQSLVDNWTTNINYPRYFAQCAPISCTYTETDYANLSHTVVLLLSLYGGLTILLRLLAIFLVNRLSKLQCYSTDIDPDSGMFQQFEEKYSLRQIILDL